MSSARVDIDSDSDRVSFFLIFAAPYSSNTGVNLDVDIETRTRLKNYGVKGRHSRLRSEKDSGDMKRVVRKRRGISSRYHPNNRKYGRIESKENIVEALVVLDKRVVGIHGRDYVEPYTLTIMNIVSKLYEDPTLGNRVKVVVVRIIVLLEDQVSLRMMLIIYYIIPRQPHSSYV